MRRYRIVIATALVAGAVTVAVAVVPTFHFAYSNPELHVAVQTAEALIGLLAAYLVFGRYRRRQRLDDLALSMAFTLLALGNLAYGALPAVFASDSTVFATWGGLIARLVGAAVFAGAAFARPVRVRPSGRQTAGIVIAATAMLAAISIGVALLESRLPTGVEAEFTPESSSRPDFDGHWALLLGQLVSFALFTLAAVAFARRAERTRDELLRWLAVGAVLAAAARLNYFLYPSLFTDFVYVGDGFRLLFYLVVLAAALREISSYWASVAAASVLEERRRIARELHDGVAQELASIGRNLAWLEADNEFVRRARASTGRALSSSRGAIAALGDSSQRPLDVVLAEAVSEIEEREGTRVALDLARDIAVRPAEREALVMIASEAITNAARHGRAELVLVELTNGRRLRLRVRDLGGGFDPQAVSPRRDSGFGLVGMRERAESIGARLRVESQPGHGTEVEVVL